MNTMDFAALAALQRDIDELLKCQVASLQHYHLTNGGFRHKYIEDPPKPSKASAATCIASLTATDKWTGDHPWSSTTHKLVSEIILTREKL